MSKEKRRKNNFSGPRNKKSVVTVKAPNELLKFLIQQFPEKKRSLIKKVLGNEQIMVGKKEIKQFNHPLKPGDVVTVNWTQRTAKSKLPKLEVVFEDDAIIVVNKQQGVPVLAGNKPSNFTVFSIIKRYLQDDDQDSGVFTVHRLDFSASGLMVFAKSKRIQRKLKDAWEAGEIKRGFSAIVKGKVPKKQEKLVSYLKMNKAMIVYSNPNNNGGERAAMVYKVRKQNANYTLLDLYPETDARNQMRVQLNDIGFPIVGDQKYGSTKSLINRLSLHAKSLQFKHPIHGEICNFSINDPVKFRRLV